MSDQTTGRLGARPGDAALSGARRSLALDARLCDLIPPLSEEERAQLEANVLENGILDPLKVWRTEGREVLIDGHHRYEIAQRHGLDFEVTEVEFESRDEAKVWMIRHQLGRRNLTPYARSELVLHLKVVLAQEAKGRMAKGGAASAPGRPTEKGCQESDDLSPSRSDEALGELAGVSRNTIRRVEVLDREADEETKARLRAGETSINHEYLRCTREARRAKRLKTLNEQALDSGMGRYPVVLADPPWRYKFSQAEGREIENHYSTMSLADICDLPVGEVCLDDCVLFLWAPSPKLAEALRVLREWDFEYVTCMVWDKEKIGMGYYARQQHELLLIGRRGTLPPPPPDARPGSVVRAPRGKHSAKPIEFYELIEGMYPDLPKLELFSRGPREGWVAWGNQACGAGNEELA